MGSDPAGGDVVARRRWHWSAILIGLLTGLGLVMRQSIMARDSLFLANTSMCWYRYRRGWPFWFLAGNESYWNRADYQGQRTLSRYSSDGFDEEFVAPSAGTAFHCQAVFGRMLFQ